MQITKTGTFLYYLILLFAYIMNNFVYTCLLTPSPPPIILAAELIKRINYILQSTGTLSTCALSQTHTCTYTHTHVLALALTFLVARFQSLALSHYFDRPINGIDTKHPNATNLWLHTHTHIQTYGVACQCECKCQCECTRV